MYSQVMKDFNILANKAEYISQLVIKETIFKTQMIFKNAEQTKMMKYFLNLTGLFDKSYNPTFYALFKKQDTVKIDFTEVNYKVLEDTQGYYKDTFRKIDFFIDTKEDLAHTTINGSVKGIPTKIMNVDIQALYRELSVDFHVTFPLTFFDMYSEDKYQLDLMISEYVDNKLNEAFKTSELICKIDFILNNIGLIRQYHLAISADFVEFLDTDYSTTREASLMLYSNKYFREWLKELPKYKNEIFYLYSEMVKLKEKTIQI